MILTEILHNKSKGENMKFCAQVEYEAIDENFSEVSDAVLQKFEQEMYGEDIEITGIEEYIKYDAIDGDKLMQAVFPKKAYDIFISHSHRDIKEALELAYYLKKEFKLTSFIDGFIWGSGDDILKEIDNRYCVNEYKWSYSYKKRNISTAYVHIMLAHSLAHTMDRCRCVIFLNTPESVDINIGNEREYSTYSPWIFYELSMLKILRIESSKRLAESKKQFNMAYDSMNIKFSIDEILEKIPVINSATLKSWKENKGKDALITLRNILYDQKNR